MNSENATTATRLQPRRKSFVLMRHRSPTNSHFGEDLMFRRIYGEDNAWCEAAPWLSRNVPKMGLTRYEPTAEVHHLFGGGSRVDCLTNLLVVCRTAHDWFHAQPKMGRLLGVWLKVQKRQFRLSEFESVSWKLMDGFLDDAYPHEMPALVPAWEELKRMFGEHDG